MSLMHICRADALHHLHRSVLLLAAVRHLLALTIVGDIHGQADGCQLRLFRHWALVIVGPLCPVSGHDHAHDG